jgi:DNA-binding response OmpR family regulator
VDRARHEARANETPLRLTRVEFALLAALVDARGELVSHADLLAAGWPASNPSTTPRRAVRPRSPAPC